MPTRIVSQAAKNRGRKECYVRLDGDDVTLVAEDQATEWNESPTDYLERYADSYKPNEVDRALADLEERFGGGARFTAEEYVTVLTDAPGPDSEAQRAALRALLG